MSMILFGGAAKFVDFTNSKGETFVANADGSKFGTMVNNVFQAYGQTSSNTTVDPLAIPLTLEATVV